jgi:hypothetical protein
MKSLKVTPKVPQCPEFNVLHEKFIPKSAEISRVHRTDVGEGGSLLR